MICVKVPLGPGSPLSPLSVSAGRRTVVINHTQMSTRLTCELSLRSLSLPLTASERSSALTRFWTVLCRAAPSCLGPLPASPPGPAAPRLMVLSERVRVDPEELLSKYKESSGSTMLVAPEEADKRLDLAEAVPVMASKASTRFLRRFTSSAVDHERR